MQDHSPLDSSPDHRALSQGVYLGMHKVAGLFTGSERLCPQHTGTSSRTFGDTLFRDGKFKGTDVCMHLEHLSL